LIDNQESLDPSSAEFNDPGEGELFELGVLGELDDELLNYCYIYY